MASIGMQVIKAQDKLFLYISNTQFLSPMHSSICPFTTLEIRLNNRMLLPVSTVITQDFPLMVLDTVRLSQAPLIVPILKISIQLLSIGAIMLVAGLCPTTLATAHLPCSCPICSHGHSCLQCPSSLHSQQIRPLEANHCDLSFQTFLQQCCFFPHC